MPIWSRDGRHILFAASSILLPRRLGGSPSILVDVLPGSPFRIGKARTVFNIKDQLVGGDADANLDRILEVVASEEPGRGLFTVVLNWPDVLSGKR